MKQDKPKAKNEPRDANRDPLSGAPGAHPVGTGIGAAAGGAVAGAAAASVAGPLGTVAGAAIGAVAGGLAGKAVAERIDPTAEDAYWRDRYTTRPYVAPGATYDDYGPAYRYGVDAYTRYSGRAFEHVEPDLATGWESSRGASKLRWEEARHAARDAWVRVGEAVDHEAPGDPIRDVR